MAKSCDSIVLCKGLHEQTLKEDIYLTFFQSAGYNCSYLYTSRLEVISSSALKRWLQSPAFFTGLILTNEHAVEAIYNILKDDVILLNQWQKLPAYCVGPAIASLAKNKLGIELCLISETGNTKDLAQIIISHKAIIKLPLLYPCSYNTYVFIKLVLSSNKIKLFKLATYHTVIRPSFNADVLDNVSTTPKIFVFFSPCIVEYFAFILREYPDCIKNIKAVAIGPWTKKSIKRAKLKVYATAANPNPTALLEAINNAAWKSNSYTTM